MKELWTFTTDFGDTAVTLPLALLVAACLILLRQPRMAIRWSLAIGGCGLTVALLKLVLRSCALVSPSGHAAMSVVVYGSLTLLIARSKSSGVKFLTVAAVTLLVAAIAFSRLALAAHSLGEITLGMLIGATWLGGFWRMQRRQAPFDLRLPWLMAACALAIAILHGMNWPIEIVLGRLSMQFLTCR